TSVGLYRPGETSVILGTAVLLAGFLLFGVGQGTDANGADRPRRPPRRDAERFRRVALPANGELLIVDNEIHDALVVDPGLDAVLRHPEADPVPLVALELLVPAGLVHRCVLAVD